MIKINGFFQDMPFLKKVNIVRRKRVCKTFLSLRVKANCAEQGKLRFVYFEGIMISLPF